MIYLSAGHHEEKPGACFNGFCEHDEAKIWCEFIAHNMGSDNALIIPDGKLKEKVDFINHRKPLAAIEVHFNSMLTGTNANGCETLHYPGSEPGLKLATALQLAVVQTGIRDRGTKEGYYRMNKTNGVDFFLAKTKCPAIIIEPEFIFNKDTILNSRDAACKNIAASLLNSLGWLKERG